MLAMKKKKRNSMPFWENERYFPFRTALVDFDVGR